MRKGRTQAQLVMTRYAKGRAREYRTMVILKGRGWLVSRSAASHGPFDVFAAKEGKVLLIQVKSGKARVQKAELEQLIQWAKASNGDAEVWHFKKRGLLEKRTVHRANRSASS